MSADLRVVLDTNVLVSAALWRQSAPGQVFEWVAGAGRLVVCEASLQELHKVLQRPKFDRIAARTQRLAFVDLVRIHGHPVEQQSQHHRAVQGACRDADDVLFLALALAAKAPTIVSGDDDLLTLHPWRGITICTPAHYLERAR